MSPNDPRRPHGGLPYAPTLLMNQGWQQPAYGHPQGPGPGFGPSPGFSPHPGFTPQRPVKRGLGTGAIFAIVLGALVLLGGAVALVAALLASDRDAPTTASSAAGLDDAGDHSALLQAKVVTLASAIQTRDSAQVEGPLLDLGILPEHARSWSLATFGPTKGPEVFSNWETGAFAELPSLIGTIRAAQAKGMTVIRVTRITTDASHTGLSKNIIGNMVVKRPLYRVEMHAPGSPEITDDIQFFAVVNGQLGYVGELVPAW